MRALAFVIVIATNVSGCTLVFDGDDDGCDVVYTADDAVAYRDPSDLLCTSWPSCDARCGPCPATQGGGAIAQPTWPECGSPCETLDEPQCAADSRCRVILDAQCTIGNYCETNFFACMPTDQATDSSIACYGADAWACSRSNECTALHSHLVCDEGPCPDPFEMCIPEGDDPGRCYDPAACDLAPPACPAGTTPGVANGCYTGACIPLEICERTPA